MGFAVSIPSYLYQHSSGYIFRLRIPDDLRSLIGKSEYRYSLRTGALRIAKHRARLLASHVQQAFLDMRNGDTNLTKESINQCINLHVRSWKVMGSTACDSGNRDQAFPLEVLQGAIQETTSLVPQASPTHKQQSCQQKNPHGVCFTELQEQYEAEMVKGGNWTEKTHSENRTIFALFVRAMGDIPIETIDKKLVSQYKGILAQLPPNLNMLPQYKGKSLEEVIASKPTKTLSVNTINKHMHWLSGLFNYAVQNGYMTYNSASGMLIKNPKRADQERELYTKEDLLKLFGSEEYRNCTQHQYWVPIIALYSGCRLEEICQLHLEDIRQEGNVWVFDINGKHEKKLKNLSSVRLVPIHPLLKAHGLLQYADTLRSRGEQRLFPCLHQRRDGYGQVVSKWFGRFRERCGIAQGKTFHSFRHTFITHLKHKQVDPFMIHELDGHSIDSETMGRYGKRYTPEILYKEAIEKIDYRLDAVEDNLN